MSTQMNTKAASDLLEALQKATWMLETKDWGPEWSIQFQAGHEIATELLSAISEGRDLEPVIAQWSQDAKDGLYEGSLTRAQRNGGKRFSWTFKP